MTAMVLVDTAEWPLVVVNWPHGAPTDAQLDEILRTLAGFYDRRHAVLHDGLRVTSMSARQRRVLTRHSALHEDDIRRSCVASAAVVPSALWRGLIAVIQRVAPTPRPFRTFGALPEAREWLVQALRRERLWNPRAANPTHAP
jgi:hypothetical protein